METLRKSKVLSVRRGAVYVRSRVVREAVVDGGRTAGLGRCWFGGIERRRCAAKAKGAMAAGRRWEMRILGCGGGIVVVMGFGELDLEMWCWSLG